MEVFEQLRTPAALILGKEQQYPLTKSLVRSVSHSELYCRKANSATTSRSITL